MSHLNSEQQALRDFIIRDHIEITQARAAEAVLPGMPDVESHNSQLDLPQSLMMKLRPARQAS